MDKNSIKKYAVWARRELISRVSQKALQYGASENEVVDANADTINGHLLTANEKKQRQALISRIKQIGYQQTMEEAAYTWFNRFSALRFMEVNGYLPTHVRVFTDEQNAFKPQILAEAIHLELDGLNMEKVYELKDQNKTDDLYKYLLITQCNALSTILPGMFTRIADYTELLFPDNLLREGSVIEQMISQIPQDNFNIEKEGQVEIIGWLYQYYISEKKNEVINIYKGSIQKEDIPAATQLFTTDWVVRYIIDNSVGRYWIERNPQSTLGNNLEYYAMPKSGTVAVHSEQITPQELTVLDPCVGSGHFLVYAFDVLMKIYRECGYSDRDAAKEIVEHNLFGLDIDERAIQLAYFAVMMKARQYDRRFFTKGIQPRIYAINETTTVDQSVFNLFGDKASLAKKVHDAFIDAKEYGSIISVPASEKDIELLANCADEIKENAEISDLFSQMQMNYALDAILPIINQSRIMTKKFAVVATNPPYLNRMNPKMKEFLCKDYKDYAGDLFSVFMYRNFSYCKMDGLLGFMTPQVWMFIKTYSKLRDYIVTNKAIVSLIQMEYSAFEEATVPICSFVLKNGKETEGGLYFKLSEYVGGMEVQRCKYLEALHDRNIGYYYEISEHCFELIEDTPICYWLSQKAFDNFVALPQLASFAEAKQGFKTGNNDLFLRLWHEVNLQKFSIYGGNKWYPCNKGGDFRKWYGNYDYVVNWENDGFLLCNYRDENGKQLSRPQNIAYNFREGITWTYISSGPISLRYSSDKMMFESSGPLCVPRKSENLLNILGLLNSVVSLYYLKALEPTINYSQGSLVKIPYAKEIETQEIRELVKECINISEEDWNYNETSWDFSKHALVKDGGSLSAIFADWEKECLSRFQSMKQNEEKLNSIMISIYGLDELHPEVKDRAVTVSLADKQRDIKSLISYAVGCMFGRYSLDQEGIVYGGGNWDASKYATYSADKDNIIPICDDDYFDDDITGRFIKWVEIVYGKDTLEENLKFIADALGGKGTPRDVIRSYFLNDFYADHLKNYQKRPIYWLFDSGKKNGFKALIYMHRYQPDTIARMRTDYVHEQQSRYRTAIADLEQRVNSASTSERVKLNKQLQKLQDQANEIRGYEEKIHHLADMMIPIDLDDGVKVNYAKFADVLAKIK